MFLVINDVIVKVRLPAGKIKSDFMSAVGHAIRYDRDNVRARLDGRRDARTRAPRSKQRKLEVVK